MKSVQNRLGDKEKTKKAKQKKYLGGLEGTGKIRERKVTMNLKKHLILCYKYKY